MKFFLLTAALLSQPFLTAECIAQTASISSDHYQEVLFEDDFSAKQLSKQWGMYKSASTIRDGVMVGITPEDADHPSVNTIRIEPQSDLEVSLRFRFKESKRFSIMYRDRECKSSHAGHICHVAITPKSLTMYDGKTGIFRLDIRNLRKAKQKLDDSLVAMLKTKSSRHNLDLDPEKWHTLIIRIQGDAMETLIDDQFVGRFESEGLAHPRKDQVNITTTQREILYDDFQIKATGKSK
ncbi:MAG: DUF1080 domain-containing protein [Planctomycetaceae bacterium]|nr:DUF1080 domain-containing protein [Planctomycetaceae bacterium]